MKVDAYLCDCCGLIKEAEHIHGILLQTDAFDRLENYPMTYKLDIAPVHVCLDCYRDHVLIPAQNAIDRRKDENLYRAKLKDLTYILKCLCIKTYHVRRENLKSKQNLHLSR